MSDTKPRCAICRLPFAKHLVDDEGPQHDTARICPHPPRLLEHYRPDNEHAQAAAELTALRQRVAELEGALSHYASMSDSPLLRDVIAANPATSFSFVARQALKEPQ